jgi:hypothetical protein
VESERRLPDDRVGQVNDERCQQARGEAAA